jgi:protein-S-isoprenylcysteine O-methyltransferase Ste14
MHDAPTAWLYRHRGATVVPFVALLLIDAHPTLDRWLLGLPLVAAGELLRLWAAAHIGDHSRGRTMRAPRLVTTGPYARMRHPLYAGNALVTGGLLVIGRAFEPWLAVAFGAAFLVQYALFIRREEALQAAADPAAWSDYAAQVPAVGWGSGVGAGAPHNARAGAPNSTRIGVEPPTGSPSWRAALRLEWSTLRTVLALLAALAVLGAWRGSP